MSGYDSVGWLIPEDYLANEFASDLTNMIFRDVTILERLSMSQKFLQVGQVWGELFELNQ
jgi:hypothetical protein